MTSIRKAKKLIKRMPTQAHPEWPFWAEFITPIKIGKYMCDSPSIALGQLEYIRKDSAFVKRCIRNPRMHGYLNPKKYGWLFTKYEDQYTLAYAVNPKN